VTRALLLLAVVACSQATAPDPDAAVLQSVVSDPHFVAWLASCEPAAFIADTTSPPAFEGEGVPYFYTDEIPAELLESARLRNREKARLPHLRYPAGIRVRPITDDATPVAWLSLPAYDTAGRRAAVSVARRNVSDECMGAGYTVLLRRNGSTWRVEQRVGEWVH
jgi:hypothetical protein